MYESNPDITTPDDDTIIWRYTDFPKFISLLSTSRLWFARADLMEDKWEGRYPIFHYFENEFGNDAKWTPGIAASIRGNIEKMQSDIRKQVCINCWHMNNKSESVAMWKLYTLMGQGIAVRSSIHRLKAAFKQSGFRISIGGVIYGDYQNRKLITKNNSLCTFTIKSQEYHYEQEVRAMILVGMPHKDAVCGEHRRGLTVEVDLKELIEQVIVAPGSPPFLFAAVQSLLDTYGMSHIKVEKSSLDHPPPIGRPLAGET